MKVELKGVDKVVAALGRVQKKVDKQADTAIQGALLRSVAMGKSRLQPMPGDPEDLHKDIASVRQSINFTYDATTKTGGFYAGNTQGDHMAAYLAFGTGEHAARFTSGLPISLQKLSMYFFVNGTGTTQTHDFFATTFIQEGQRLKDKLKNLKVAW